MAGRGEFAGTERYELRKLLGEGGMGVVYEAFDRESETVIALKVLREEDPQRRLRFKREFRAVEKLEHPNLVRLGELVESAGTLFYTMELVDGVDFLDHVRLDPDAPVRRPDPPTRDLRAPVGDHDQPQPAHPSDGSRAIGFDEARLRSSLRQLALGLAALHSDDKLHRDVKPSNVLVASDGRTVLLDFGLVLPTSDIRITGAGGAMGTAVYMAPEQALDRALGPPADWYSVGVMLYEALTGRIPFDGSAWDVMVQKQRKAPPPPSTLVPDIPADLDELCAALLQTDPDDRPSESDILEQLQVEPTSANGTSASALGAARARRDTRDPIPAFVGRTTELAELQAAYERAHGRATVIVIDGQSGVGKSELARHFTAQVSPEALVLAGRCYERESIPYKAVDGVIDALSAFLARLPPEEARTLLPRRRALLRQLFPVLQRVEAIATAPYERRDAVDPLEQRDSTFRALRSMFTAIAQTRRVVIVIDDLQWTDSDSLSLLEDLLQPDNAPRVLLVATVRSTRRGDVPEHVENMLATLGDDVRRLSLGPLSETSAHELATRFVPEFASHHSGTANALVAEADGHPMFLIELLRYVTTNPGRGVTIRLDDALWSRVVDLPADARTVLEIVCVAGTPMPQGVIAQATELDGAAWARAVSRVRAENLARTGGDRPTDMIEPYHDRVREAVTAHLGADALARIHERLAVALECAGAAQTNPNALVRHLVAIGERERAAQNAERGARDARDAMAFDRAVELYRTALDLGADTGDITTRQRVRLQLAEALANAGRSMEAGDAYADAAADADPDTQLACQQRAAENYLISGHLERARELVTAVLQRFDITFPATPKRALSTLVWARVKLRLRGKRWTQRREQQIPPDDLARFDVLRTIAQGLGAVDSIRAAGFQCQATLLALRMGEPSRVAFALGYESIFYSVEGGRKLRRAEALLADARAIAGRLDNPHLDAWLSMAEAMSCFTTGRFRHGAETLGRAEKLLSEGAGTTWELNQARLFRLQTLRFMGRYRELREEFTRLSRLASQRGDRYTATSMNRSHSFLALVDDDPERAHRIRENTSWVPPAGAFHLQHWYDLRARTEIYLYDGNVANHMEELTADFGALRRSLLPRIQLTRALSMWTWGRALFAASIVTGSTRHRDEATNVSRRLQREHAGYADAWGGLLAAGLAAHGGDTSAAQGMLQHAAARADEHEMALIAAVARRKLGVLVGGERGAALVAAADATMQSETIRNPERMANTMCPGI